MFPVVIVIYKAPHQQTQEFPIVWHSHVTKIIVSYSAHSYESPLGESFLYAWAPVFENWILLPVSSVI